MSFLYGARVHNLYRVARKIAVRNADKLGPWPPVTFKASGRTYFFLFRAMLQPVRSLEEPMVRQEFAYVAENLLLRGGYRRTHFQADQTTLQAVSQMGILYERSIDVLDAQGVEEFTPGFTWDNARVRKPETFKFQELILQALLRRLLSDRDMLGSILTSIATLGNLEPDSLEVLGEKALPEGHVDILIKERVPTGISRKILAEVKTGNATSQDIHQLSAYMRETGKECLGGLLVARGFSRKTLAVADGRGIRALTYDFEGTDRRGTYSFGELQSKLRVVKA